MKLVTFSGESPARALKAAQSQYGEEALVVSTKEIRKKSLNRPALYEVVVAVEEDAVAASQASSTASSQKRNSNPYDKANPSSLAAIPEDVTLELSNVVQQISQIANVQEDQFQQRLKAHGASSPKADAGASLDAPVSAAASSPRSGESGVVPAKPDMDLKELKLIKTEINKLGDKIKLIQNMFWDEKGPKQEELAIPHEFAEIYRLAKMSGMNRVHLDKIMQLTLEHMPLKMRDNSTLIKRYFREVLRKMVLCRKESEFSESKKIMMLVGPTGVGKTTTLAKLAARYSFLLPKKHKVGIITLDSYKIGAVEQLMWYAKKMKLSIDTVVDPPEFVSAINSLQHCDYIFIDTVGSSQYDKQKIEMLQSYLNCESHVGIDVTLVVAASTKPDDLQEIYRTYRPLNLDSSIITKLDETRTYGNVFSLMYETRLPVSYFSTGQHVPNDLRMASSDYLVDCLLDGFSKEEVS